MANDNKVLIVGMGYVGLPLFIRLKKKFCTIGFDTDNKRIKYLKKKIDKNGEYKKKDLILYNKSKITNKSLALKKANFFIIHFLAESARNSPHAF